MNANNSSPEPSQNPLETTRVCRTCLLALPIGRFRRRRAGTEIRHTQCRSCRLAADAARRAAKRGRTIDRFAQQVNRFKSNPRRLLLLADDVIHSFGGVRRFAAAYYATYQDVSRRGKSAQAIRLLVAILACQCAAKSAQVGPPEYEQMTDEELDSVMRRQTRDLVRENPQLAIEAARQLGWSITPPS